jgi:hypothetical protein
LVSFYNVTDGAEVCRDRRQKTQEKSKKIKRKN